VSEEEHRAQHSYKEHLRDHPHIIQALEAEFIGMEHAMVEARQVMDAKDMTEEEIRRALWKQFCVVCGLYVTGTQTSLPPATGPAIVLHCAENCGMRSFSNPSQVAPIQIAKLASPQMREIVITSVCTAGAFRNLKSNALKTALTQLREDVDRELAKKTERQKRWVAENAPKRIAAEANYGHYGPQNNQNA
jgi:hypothetical protein